MTNNLKTRAYALIVGVGDYTHDGYQNLPATVHDAKALTAVLTDPTRCGYLPKNVQTVTGETATLLEIRTALQELAQSTNREATVFVYFSGHGGRVLENGAWHSYLCPRQADPARLGETAVSVTEFSDLLATIPAKRLLVVLDACHASGSATLKSADGTVVWKAGLPEDYYEALSRGSGRVVIASSKAEQVSYVRLQGDLSVFTWHFREALRGKAAVRGDGLIHVLDVFHYVNEQVQAEQADQTPVLKVSDMDLNFAIALDRGGKGAGGSRLPKPALDTIREQIVQDPVAGAKVLSDHLQTRPEWAAKRNEIDLKRAELERIQRELALFGNDPQGQTAKNRAVFFLLQQCLELEQELVTTKQAAVSKSGIERRFHTANIRKLLTKAFSDYELTELLYDEPDFKPILDAVGTRTRKAELIQELLDYAERRLLLGQLLTLLQAASPERFSLYQPYER